MASTPAGTPKSIGPATAAVLRFYSGLDRSKVIAKAAKEVMLGKSLADALEDNKLRDGSLPCTRQNLCQHVKRKKAALGISASEEAPDLSTEKGRRHHAHKLALEKYHKCAAEGTVGKGKGYGMSDIQKEMETKILRPSDKRLKYRTLVDHASKGNGYNPKRGRPVVQDHWCPDGNGWKPKIANTKPCFVIPPCSREEIQVGSPVHWVPARVWDSDCVADGHLLYSVVYNKTRTDSNGEDYLKEDRVPEVFIKANVGEKEMDHSDMDFDFKMHNRFMQYAIIRERHYGNKTTFIKVQRKGATICASRANASSLPFLVSLAPLALEPLHPEEGQTTCYFSGRGPCCQGSPLRTHRPWL